MNTRRADLDWLRVLAFGLLILYHSGMAWSGWNWHLMSDEPMSWLREVMRFTNRWRMPLIFLVSGGAVVLALGQRTAGIFAADRLRRLLLPLVFGMVVLVPPQVFAERLFRGQFSGSYIDWLPQAFAGGAYPSGNVSWHHLWFIAYVLVLTFALLPCFLWARTASGQAVQAKAARALSRVGLHWLMAVPLAASILWLAPLSRNTNGVIGDWHGLFYYGVLLLYGGFVFGTRDMLALLSRQRWISLVVGIAAYAALYATFFEGTVVPSIAHVDRPLYALLSGVNTMAWLFTAVGFTHRYLAMRPRFLGEATEAVYPFYMLHQTVTVIVVYWLLKMDVPSVGGFILAAVTTFVVTWMTYMWLVRPFALVRPLFGMKAGPLPLRAAAL